MTARRRPACLAPSTSLHLDPHGDVRACCQNSWFLLGRYPQQSLEEIWQGTAAQELRDRLDVGDFSAGCHACAAGSLDDLRGATYARRFDHLVAPDVALPLWPVQLELQLSTRCNLQCTMCTGQLSSAIRAQREHLPPLPRPYDDAFFGQLRPFLAHVERIELLGGEPFLAEETKTLVAMLDDLGRRPRIHVTTNGTIWTPWVESFLTRFDVDVTISIEGSTAAVFESIRVGASFSTVIENLARFTAAARPGTTVDLATCLMRESVGDLHGLLRRADAADIDVYVNTVTDPSSSSLALMPADELRSVLAELEAQGAVAPLTRNRAVWDRELHRLRRLLAEQLSRSGGAPRGDQAGPDEDLRAWAAGSSVHTFLADSHQVLVAVEPDASDVFGLDLRPVLGRPLETWIEPLRARYGAVVASNRSRRGDGGEEWVLHLDGDLGPQTVRARRAPEPGGDRWFVHLRPGHHAAVQGAVAVDEPVRRVAIES